MVSHETLAAFTPDIFQQVADGQSQQGGDEPLTADIAAARFRGLSAEIRGCAILGPAGVLAATGDRDRWLEPALGLLAAADTAAGGSASHAHVATEDGEAYAVRLAGLAMVAVTDRFTLASLVLADMRAALREVARRNAAPLEEAA
jgi:hypothetical protein